MEATDQSGAAGAVLSATTPRVSRKQAQRRSLSIELVAADLVAIMLSFAFACWFWLGAVELDEIGPILAVLVPIYLVISLNQNAFAARMTIDFGPSARKATLSFATATALILLIAFFLKVSAEFSRMVIAIGSLSALVAIACARLLVTRHGRALLGDNPFFDLVIRDRVDGPADAIDAETAGVVPIATDNAASRRLGLLARGADRVVVHCAPEARAQWAFALKSLAIRGEIIAPELDSLSPLGLTQYGGHTSMLLSANPLNLSQRVLKRGFDLIITIAMLPPLGVIFVVVGLAIKLDSRGPVFFRQDRIGLGNRPFALWKFRSMRTDMQDNAAARLTDRDDPRVTRIGGFLRRTSIDELPQLINVIAGDMSLVGPRPHAEKALAGDSLYWEVDAAYWHRHAVKPGITGLAQVRGYRGNTLHEDNLRDRLQADLEYVANWTVMTDLRILVRTFGVLSHHNAY